MKNQILYYTLLAEEKNMLFKLCKLILNNIYSFEYIKKWVDGKECRQKVSAYNKYKDRFDTKIIENVNNNSIDTTIMYYNGKYYINIPLLSSFKSTFYGSNVFTSYDEIRNFIHANGTKVDDVVLAYIGCSTFFTKFPNGLIKINDEI